MKKAKPLALLGKAIKWILLWGFAIFELFPLVQLLLNSFRNDAEIKTFPLGFPKEWTLANYPETWKRGGYGQAFINSLWISFVTILITVTIISIAAYALAKLDFKGRRAVGRL